MRFKERVKYVDCLKIIHDADEHIRRASKDLPVLARKQPSSTTEQMLESLDQVMEAQDLLLKWHVARDKFLSMVLLPYATIKETSDAYIEAANLSMRVLGSINRLVYRACGKPS